MSIQATADDVPVKVGMRRALLSVYDKVLRLRYPNSEHVTSIQIDELEQVVVDHKKVALLFTQPRRVNPNTKRAVSSVVISGERSTCALEGTKTVDVRQVETIETACDRASLHILPNRTVVVWFSSHCKVIENPEFILLQRTKGGMSTYDAHVLHSKSNETTSVDMLPHSSMEKWVTAFGNEAVIDIGADPVEPRTLKFLYDADSAAWQPQHLLLSESDSSQEDSESEYCTGDSENNMSTSSDSDMSYYSEDDINV